MRGRPVKSVIRQNIVEILHYLGEGYGYQLSKIYNELFAPVTQRSIYYHLHKGTKTNEFEIHNIRVEKGDYSWGENVEKIYYSLGRGAEPRGLKKVQKFVRPQEITKKKKGLLSRWRKK